MYTTDDSIQLDAIVHHSKVFHFSLKVDGFLLKV